MVLKYLIKPIFVDNLLVEKLSNATLPINGSFMDKIELGLPDGFLLEINDFFLLANHADYIYLCIIYTILISGVFIWNWTQSIIIGVKLHHNLIN